MTSPFNRIRFRGLVFAEPLFAPTAGSDALEGMVTVRLNNLHKSARFDDSLRWDVPDSWEVTPQAMHLVAGPGETAEATFAVRALGERLPLPVVSARFPYRDDKGYQVELPLRVVRQAGSAMASEPPSIDGTPDELIWSSAMVEFMANGDNPAATDPTRVYLTYDQDNLYVAARCMEPVMDSLRAAVDERDGAVYGEDCFGLFIQPDPAEDTAYQIYVNPNGVIFDQCLTADADNYWGGEADWNATAEVAVSRTEKAWILEMRLPLAQWGVQAKPGDRLPINFRRKQARLGTGAQWQSPLEYDPLSYGVLILQ